MKHTISLLFLLVSIFRLDAQTFNGQGGLLIPPGAPGQTIGITQSPCTVTGVGVLGGCALIANVEIDLTHTWVGDIGILLIGPGGQILDLSTGNGGANDNYTNTVFSDNAADFITSGTPPFTGTWRPEGRATSLTAPYTNAPPLGTHTFASTFNGTNADGVWTLYINDYVALDIGVLNSWSITFTSSGTVTANAGPDVNLCAGSSTTLTASGGTVYQWSNGAASASTSVSPTTTTTYTVTVSEPGCGTDTDEVLVTVNPLPTVSFTITNPNICPGDCPTFGLNFTGTPPFNLTGNLTVFGIPINNFSQTFNINTGSLTICIPPGTPQGQVMIKATSLTDANCTCN